MHWRRLAIALVLLVAAAVVDRTFVQVPEHRPHPASALLVLGGVGDRAALARRLLAAGMAPVEVRSVGRDAGCPLSDGGVPVICFTPDPFSTRGEAEAFARMARTHGWTSVLVVAGHSQQWRAGLRVRRCFPGAVEVVGAPTKGLGDAVHEAVYEVAASVKAEAWQRAC